MATVLRRPRARDDLAEIWDYIADDSVEQADVFIDRLDATFHTLAGQPLMRRAREELAPGLRSFPLGRYVIFYQPPPDGVAIVRALHGARDVEERFESQ